MVRWFSWPFPTEFYRLYFIYDFFIFITDQTKTYTNKNSERVFHTICELIQWLQAVKQHVRWQTSCRFLGAHLLRLKYERHCQDWSVTRCQHRRCWLLKRCCRDRRPGPTRSTTDTAKLWPKLWWRAPYCTSSQDRFKKSHEIAILIRKQNCSYIG
jgi:hypothetical protein